MKSTQETLVRSPRRNESIEDIQGAKSKTLPKQARAAQQSDDPRSKWVLAALDLVADWIPMVWSRLGSSTYADNEV